MYDHSTHFVMSLIINAVGVVLLIAQGWRQPTLGYTCSEEVNAVGVVLLIAQGWRQPTLGYTCSEEVNAVGVVLFLRGMPQ